MCAVESVVGTVIYNTIFAMKQLELLHNMWESKTKQIIEPTPFLSIARNIR